jgi:hypothetical protein
MSNDGKREKIRRASVMDHYGLKGLLLFTIAIFSALSIGGKAFSADPLLIIGTVQRVSGTATVVRQDQILPAKTGLEIHANDTLRTDADGSIGVVFHDDTALSLGPGSVLVIDEFVYAPRQGKLSLIFRMMKGTAVYLSGLIAKLAPDSVHFVTPSASVGVRGTKFAVKVDER